MNEVKISEWKRKVLAKNARWEVARFMEGPSALPSDRTKVIIHPVVG